MVTWPDVGTSSPAIMRRIVDLPQPEGPTSAVVFPAAKSRSVGLSATSPPFHVFDSPRQETIGEDLGSAAMDVFKDGTVPQVRGHGAAQQGQGLDIGGNSLIAPPAKAIGIGQL